MADIFNTINSSTPNSVARAIANEVVAGKNAIAAALVSKGQLVENIDTFESMAQKVLSITGDVNVTPIQGIPSDWHDLAQVVAQNTLAEFPYSFAILLSKSIQSIQLTGSNRYITSDGGLFAGDRMHTFDVLKDDLGGDANATFTGILCGLTTPITIQANNVGSVGNVKLTGNGTSVNALIASWNAAHPTNQLTLTAGDGEQIPTAGFKGVVTGMTTVVEICENAGGAFGNITLVADGVKTINTLISEWNAANATKQITLINGSDTQIPTSNITLTTEDILLTGGVIGNAGKSTRWVVFLNDINNVSPTCNFGSISNAEGITLAGGYLIQVYIGKISIKNLRFSYVAIVDRVYFQSRIGVDVPLEFSSSIFNNSSRHNKLIFPDGISEFVVTATQVLYNASSIHTIEFQEGTTKIEFSGDNSLNGLTSLTSFILPQTLKIFNISGLNQFVMSSARSSTLPYLKFPQGIEEIRMNTQTLFSYANIINFVVPDSVKVLTFVAINQFQNCQWLSYMYLSNPSVSFIGFGASAFVNSPNLKNIEVKQGWNWTLNGLGSAPLTQSNILNNLFLRLVDKRKDGINPTTVTTSTANQIVTAINGNFTNVFRVGDTITIAAGAVRTIHSIQSDDQLTLTTNAATTGSDQTYNINKTLVLGATNLAKMTAAELLIATDKGWTLA